MPIIINKHTVEITHGTQKHTQTTWFVPELRHQRYYCRALRWKSNWSPAMEMSSMLRSRCSSLEGWGGEVLHQNVGGPFWVYETTQLLRCCPETPMDPSTKNLEAEEVSLHQHLKNILEVIFNYRFKPMSGARRLLSPHRNFTRFQVPRITCTSKNTLTILLGGERVCACQVPHRQTHGIKSNWPLLLLITNWTKLSNLTPGLEAVPAPLWATPPHNLPQNQSKRARLPCTSLHQHARHSPKPYNAAPQARKTSAALLCSLSRCKN